MTAAAEPGRGDLSVLQEAIPGRPTSSDSGALSARSTPSLWGEASFMEQCTSWGYARTDAI